MSRNHRSFLVGLNVVCVLVFVPLTHAASGALQIVPTTTLAAETGNNTSTASTFATQTNGNIGPTNISKVPYRSLLYPGSNTLLWAHFMGWFGESNHMNVGYTSSNAAQVHNQVNDAMSRGLTAFMLDWYGPKNGMPNNTLLALRTEAESRGGQFFFGLMYDGGALSACHSTAGCDLTQQTISDLTYAYNTFENSPAYLRLNNRPVVMFFAPDRYGTLNWSLIASSVPGNPLFVFQDNGGFTHTATSGSLAWVHIDTTNANNWQQSYLDSFFATAQKYPAEYTWSTAYKGFNDTLAAWTANRIMNQNCGQTWLNTFSEMNKYWSSAKQLEAIQLVTWNDYEEGTELESGIDNCVSVAVSVSGTSLNWSLTAGAESTIDHYTVFISSDGQNLMTLGDVAAGTHTFDLGALQLDPATYTLYVKAIGRPNLTNKMSAAVQYTVNNVAPSVNLIVTPQSGIAKLSVTADASSSTAAFGTIAGSTIDFGDGSAASGPIATHLYVTPGTYTVTATVKDTYGASATATQPVNVINQPPIAQLSLSATTGIAGLSSFTASTAASSDPDGTIASSAINFGDGTVVSGPTASHFYTNAGTYTVTATVTDNLNATSSKTQTVTVSANVAPVVQLSAPQTAVAGVTNVSVSTAGSTAPNGSITSTIISFGDGFSASSATANHQYAAAGSYTISAKVTDNFGVSSTKSASITVTSSVAPSVQLSLSTASGVAPVAVAATTAGSTAANGSIASTTINFGDGTVISAASASHTYSSAGSYVVTATVTDNLGMSGTATKVVTVTPAGVTVTSPIAANGTLSSNVNVVASAASGNGITKMRIYLDSVSVYVTQSPALNVNLAVASGQHNLTVQAWDAAGKVFKNTQMITVANQAPIAKLSVTPASAVGPVTVSASTPGSYDPDGSIASTTIDFGDGTVINGTSAKHTYTAVGTYAVKATVIDNLGASSTALQNVTVNAGVSVSAPIGGSNVGSPVQFIAQAISAHTITAMHIYVDGASVYFVRAGQLNTYVTMASGSHNVTVQAWDSSGAVFKNSFALAVK